MLTETRVPIARIKSTLRSQTFRGEGPWGPFSTLAPECQQPSLCQSTHVNASYTDSHLSAALWYGTLCLREMEVYVVSVDTI